MPKIIRFSVGEAAWHSEKTTGFGFRTKQNSNLSSKHDLALVFTSEK